MYAVVEFDDDGVAVVNSKWLTPKKGEVFWPPIKNSLKFAKQLKQPEQMIDEESWKIYKLNRVFYETDDLEKANIKLKKAEVTSDLQTDVEDSLNLIQPNKRHIVKKRHFISSDSEEDSEMQVNKFSKLPNPPKLRLSINKPKERFNSVVRGSPSTDKFLTDSEANVHSKNLSALEMSPILTKEKNTESKIRNPLIGNSAFFPSESAPIMEENTDTSCARNLSDKKFWSLLLEIKCQNSEILAILKDKGLGRNQPNETKFPCELPLASDVDVQNFEKFLMQKENIELLTSYLSESGGKDIPTRTNRILKRLLDDGLATEYNFYGKRSNKKPFSLLKLRNCVVGAVQLQGQAAEQDIEDYIKTWLKHAPERIKKRNAEIPQA